MQGLQEMWVQTLGHEDLLKEETATHSSILAWEIPWAEEPGGLQSMGQHKNQNSTVFIEDRKDVRKQRNRIQNKVTQSK